MIQSEDSDASYMTAEDHETGAFSQVVPNFGKNAGESSIEFYRGRSVPWETSRKVAFGLKGGLKGGRKGPNGAERAEALIANEECDIVGC